MIKFMELYKIANDIDCIYDEMYTLVSRGIISDKSGEYNNLIEKAKILVLQESSIFDSLKKEEIENILEELRILIRDNFELGMGDEIDTIEEIGLFFKNICGSCGNNINELSIGSILRVIDRLKNQKFILDKKAIRIRLKKNNEQLIPYQVSIWDAVMTYLNLNVLKNIKDKIYGIVPKSKSDIKFIEYLKHNLDCTKIECFYATFMAEIYALYAFNDIDKIAIPNIEMIKKLPIFDNDLYNEFLLNDAKVLADELASLDYLERTPECIFYFLKLVTSFEVTITNMNKNDLKKVADYCVGLTNENNLPCMEGINKFVKARIKKG